MVSPFSVLKRRHIIRMPTCWEIVKLGCPLRVLTNFGRPLPMDEVKLIVQLSNFRLNGRSRVWPFQTLCPTYNLRAFVLNYYLTTPTNKILSILLNEVSLPRIRRFHLCHDRIQVLDSSVETDLLRGNLLLHHLRGALFQSLFIGWFLRCECTNADSFSKGIVIFILFNTFVRSVLKYLLFPRV